MSSDAVYLAALLLGWIAPLGLGMLLFFKKVTSPSLRVVLSIILGLGVVWLIIATLSLDSLPHTRGKAELVHCQSYLRQLGLGIQMYRDDFNGQLPLSLNQTVASYIGSREPPTLFDSSLEPPILYVGKTHRGSAADFPFYYWPRANPKPQDMLCWDALPHVIHHGILRFSSTSQRNVLFADMHVEVLNEPDFQSLYARETGTSAH